MKTLKKIRRVLFPTTKEIMEGRESKVIGMEIDAMEARIWVDSLVEDVVRAGGNPSLIPQDHFDSWERLSEFQQGSAFFYLVGKHYSAIRDQCI